MEAAQKPVTWTTNTTTDAEFSTRAKEFRTRLWVQGYKNHGPHDQPWDADARQLIDAWIFETYGGDETNLPPAHEVSEKLAKDKSVDDPLVLAAAGFVAVEKRDRIELLERAVKSFEKSDYPAYTKYLTTVNLAANTTNRTRRAELDQMSVKQFGEMFHDKTIMPADQESIAESLLNGWAENFFKRNESQLYPIAKNAGKDFRWLALILEGEYHIDAAWKSRGNGYANSVTEQGWKGFTDELALARKNLTEAWELHPEWPQAAVKMMHVALGDSDITEMRLWFDRAVTAQLDYAPAWQQMRWGLRPRWFGSHEAMIAFGSTCVNTRRFDTDVPRMFFDSISEVESESELEPGEHIYGQEDVWPDLKKMYEGYIGAGSNLKGWRSVYAVIAYYAGKYDVARAQFDALNWDPDTTRFEGWSVDLSLLPLEIAARTGPAADSVNRAESRRSRDDIGAALKLYQELDGSTIADTRTREFVKARLASLEAEQHLEKGEWINLQPKDDHDPNWVFLRGNAHVQPDGALEVESGPGGHLLYSRVRVGTQFEVRGEFEVVKMPNRAFQAGIVMGLPDLKGHHWNSLRIIRNGAKSHNVSFGHEFTSHHTSQQTKVNNERDSFEFRLEDSRGTATLNGNEVLRNVDQPMALHVRDDEYLLGLGAYNGAGTNVVRYRNVQVRRLLDSAPKSAKKRS